MKRSPPRLGSVYALGLALAGCTETIRLSSQPHDASPAQDAAAVSSGPTCTRARLDEQTLSHAVAGDPCTGLAARTFRMGLCACDGMTLAAGLTADSFDSSASAGARDEPGVGIGTNGSFTGSGPLEVYGTLSVGGPVSLLRGGSFHLTGNLYANGDLQLDQADVQLDRDLWVGRNIVANDASARVTGQVHQTPRSLLAPTVSATAGFVSEPSISLEQPCSCTGAVGVDFIRVRQALASDSDNSRAGLAADALSRAAQVTLPGCGRYLFDAGAAPSARWSSRGRALVFIDGDLEIADRLQVELGERGELDVFVRGELHIQPGARIESARPGALRFYVDGLSALQLTQGAELQASLYAPRTSVSITQEQTFTGALHVRALSASAPLQLHHDRAVLAPAPGAGPCTTPSCARDVDCPAPRLCARGQCQ